MRYTLWNEECLEAMKRIPDGSVDMVMCDLPYGTTQNKWDSVIDLPSLWSAYRRICKPSAAIVLTAAQPFTSVLVCSNLKNFKYDWVWQKEPTGNLNAKRRPMSEHESILVFGSPATQYKPQGLRPCLRKRGANDNSRTKCYGSQKEKAYVQRVTGYPTSVLSVSKDRGEHPTQKPVALMEYLIKTYTNQGDLVLDNCMGSGTTGVACMNLGRQFIGIEKDTENGYFQIAECRIKEAFEKNKVTEEDWL